MSSKLKCGTVMFHMLFQALKHNSSLTHRYVVLFAIFGIQLYQTQHEMWMCQHVHSLLLCSPPEGWLWTPFPSITVLILVLPRLKPFLGCRRPVLPQHKVKGHHYRSWTEGGDSLYDVSYKKKLLLLLHCSGCSFYKITGFNVWNNLMFFRSYSCWQ